MILVRSNFEAFLKRNKLYINFNMFTNVDSSGVNYSIYEEGTNKCILSAHSATLGHTFFTKRKLRKLGYL